MTKRLVSLLIALGAVLCMALPAQAARRTVLIHDAQQLLAFADNCRLDSYSQELTVFLKNDIDLTGLEFDGIPSFSGTFDGGGHAISGVQLDAEGSVQGLFRYLSAAAQVKNLHVRGTVNPGGSRAQVGGIAGSNAGKITACSFTGTVDGSEAVGGLVGINLVTGIVERSTASGTVTGDHFTGGIAGQNLGVIRTCTNNAGINRTPKENKVELSGITLDSLTGTEAAVTATDIGGIAGYSSGVIRGCSNQGDVGYRNMGYNVGGIAGTQSGYLVSCKNYGAVSGRKEVGGIVGQLEPVACIRYSQDTLQILQTQLGDMNTLVDRASGNASYGTAQLTGYMNTLQSHTQNAQSAVESLLPDPEAPELPDADTLLAAQNTLTESLTAMPGTLRSAASAAENTATGLIRDLGAITAQLNAMGQTVESAGENLGAAIADVSDGDTPEDLTGKVERCTNMGAVLGDLNVGGIAGSVAPENDLDILEDWQSIGQLSANFEGRLRAVILGCHNRAGVTAGKQNAGGIAGWQSMGLVKNCTVTAAVHCGGSFAGGISGLSTGFIRESSVRGAVSGSSCVGGIAGSAAIATDCLSLVQLTAGERMGAIFGLARQPGSHVEQPILGNRYAWVDADPGAIDGISYDALAQSIPLKDFLALEGLPEMMKTVTVTFVPQNGTPQTVTLTPGDPLKPEMIPAVPEKTGFIGSWAGLGSAELSSICTDLTFEASYVSRGSVLAGDESRNGRPVLLLQGDFGPAARVSVGEEAAAPALQAGQRLLACRSFAVTDAGSITAARYLLPSDAEAQNLRVLAKNGEKWRDASCRINGSYAVIALEPGDTAIALVQLPEESRLPLILGAAAALTLLAAAALLLHKRKKKKAPQSTET